MEFCLIKSAGVSTKSGVAQNDGTSWRRTKTSMRRVPVLRGAGRNQSWPIYRSGVI